MSKIQNVVDHLKRYGKINGKQIVYDYHLNYPSCVIRDIRERKNLKIKSVPVAGTKFVDYCLIRNTELNVKF